VYVGNVQLAASSRPPFYSTTPPGGRPRSGPTRVAVMAWRSGNALYPINEVAVHRAGLVVGWVTACRQVNHLIICNQPPRSTLLSLRGS